jgi:hypothetical protein
MFVLDGSIWGKIHKIMWMRNPKKNKKAIHPAAQGKIAYSR